VAAKTRDLRAEIAERERTQELLRQSQKMEAVGQLAGGIAHDFNNLLSAIIGYTDLTLSLGDELQPEIVRNDLCEIKRAGERGAALTKQILAFSRRQALRPQVLSLEDIELITHLDPDLGHAEVDPHQFEQVLINLAVNARDAMPSGGQLILETKNTELDHDYCLTRPDATPGDYVMLSVTDTGIGMSAETVSRVFEPFFTTKAPERGTGLGLSTAYGIVRQSGGSICVYSELGKGTSFKLYLPRVAKSEPDPTIHTTTITRTQGQETVLVVEDEESLRRLTARILGRLGYTVLTAATADEALRIVDANDRPIDLLLTDVVLPGSAQGNDLAAEMVVTRPDLPVLFMSGYTRNATIHTAKLDVSADFLEKPFTPDVLAAKVRDVLDGAVREYPPAQQ
jgi:CheY-like chemotaxis protein